MAWGLREARAGVAFGLFFLLPAFSAFADVELGTILSESASLLRWDSSRGVGIIESSENEFAFAPGMSWGLLNYRKRIVTGAITRAADGAILFTDAGARALEAALRSTHPQSALPSGSTRPRIAAIIIDPGHGGRDPGTSHVHRVDGKPVEFVEKEIVLAIGREVYAQLLKRYPDKRIILTRGEDSYLSLEQRTAIANDVKLRDNEAEIFVSIHANASFNPDSKGYEVWYLPPTYRRNVVDPKTLKGPANDLYPILNSMREEEYTVESVLLGRRILDGIHSAVAGAEVSRGLKAESWFVVRNSKMPAVLVEVGFLTNREEAIRLHDEAYLKKIELGIYNGISSFVSYFDNSSGFQE